MTSTSKQRNDVSRTQRTAALSRLAVRIPCLRRVECEAWETLQTCPVHERTLTRLNAAPTCHLAIALVLWSNGVAEDELNRSALCDRLFSEGSTPRSRTDQQNPPGAPVGIGFRFFTIYALRVL